jgi:hypothetical protein
MMDFFIKPLTVTVPGILCLATAAFFYLFINFFIRSLGTVQRTLDFRLKSRSE